MSAPHMWVDISVVRYSKEIDIMKTAKGKNFSGIHFNTTGSSIAINKSEVI